MAYISAKKTVTAALPMEMIMEFLIKLPVLSLLRFKVVSKSWLVLIESPTFINLHVHQSVKSKKDRHIISSGFALSKAELNEDSSYNLWFSKLDESLFNVNINIGVRMFSVIGVCRGIVCIFNFNLTLMTLYNPSTKMHRDINFPAVFDTLRMPDVGSGGFGYDSKADDYKVLIFTHPHARAYPNNALVYSLKNNSWKHVNNWLFSTTKKRPCGRGVLVNEALHYLVRDGKRDDAMAKAMCIWSFDLHSETVSFLDLPECRDVWIHIELQRLEESLCVLHKFEMYFDCWMMKEYGNNESWTLLYRVNKNHDSLLGIRPLALSEDRGLVLIREALSFMPQRSQMRWFNLKTQETKDVSIDGRSSYSLGYLHVLEGSLVSLGEQQGFQKC